MKILELENEPLSKLRGMAKTLNIPNSNRLKKETLAMMIREAEAQKEGIELRGGILDNQPWFWQNVLNFLRAPGRRFLNKVEAQRWLAKAEAAEHSQNLNDLKEAVVRVWEMQPPDQVELSKQQAAQSGLRA